MEYDKDRVDEVSLALLYLTSSHGAYGTRAWKGLDWETLDRLYKKGYIGNPKEKSPTVVVTAEGAKRSEALFFEYFGVKE